jgi:uncharacterized membrane protein YphA (DoxX/SURF4 family)
VAVKHIARLLAPLLLAWITSGSALAHVKWFHDGPKPPMNFAALLEPVTLALVLAVSAVVIALWFVQRARGGTSLLPSVEWFGATPERRMGLYGFVPAILGVHLAVTLFVSGVNGHLFSPDNALPGATAYLFGLAQAGIALSLFYGGLARVSAIFLGGLWFAGLFIFGLEAMLDNALILGFAAFFWFAGRGPISIDRLILPRLEPSITAMRRAIPALRIGVGLSLTAAAFSEKLANPALAASFLQQQPLNFTSSLGLPIPDALFAQFAGSVELLVGLCLLFNVFAREIIVIAWFPINLTLTIFDSTELVGHLPIYGAMAVLLVWENGPKNLELWTRGLREGPLPVETKNVPQA